MRSTASILVFFLTIGFCGLFAAQSDSKLTTTNDKVNSMQTNDTSDKSPNPVVVIQTNLGDIEVELNQEKAPNTVKNFLQYVKSDFYSGTIFHRVIKNFMIQGGGFTKDMVQKKTNPPIAIESDNGLKNDKGTIAMARTSDPNSATSQFFINTKDNSFLNYTSPTAQGYGYAVFGKVIKGMDIVDKIEDSKTTSVGYMSDVPVNAIVIDKIYKK
ncbi:MAG TPA: peptidylprolyl isomerase [Lentisphaeria bacterium]|nr:peptidylprolyl isomerase [Lentisphaeria bacterium]